MPFINQNGSLLPEGAPLSTGNSSFRHGYGLFETMKMFRGSILLEDYHWHRLRQGMGLLQMKEDGLPDNNHLAEQVRELGERNGCLGSGRVRLQVSEDGGVLQYLIEAVPLDEKENRLNDRGWDIGLYPYARRSCEAFSNLKSTSHLSYIMAGRYAAEKGLDDCLLLNTESGISDASIANVFLFRQDELITPALHQGCVNGVMRRWLLEKAKELGYVARQEVVQEDDLLNADEVFLTNAIRGIRWVRSFGEKQYSNERTRSFYRKTLSTIYG